MHITCFINIVVQCHTVQIRFSLIYVMPNNNISDCIDLASLFDHLWHVQDFVRGPLCWPSVQTILFPWKERDIVFYSAFPGFEVLVICLYPSSEWSEHWWI